MARAACRCTLRRCLSDASRARHAVVVRRRLRPARPAHEGEAHELPPSARVFKSNAVVERVWRRLLNKAEAELQQLPELLLPLRRAKEAAKEAARAAARGRVVSADASALELALRPLVIAAIGGVARVFMRVANTTTVRPRSVVAPCLI